MSTDKAGGEGPLAGATVEKQAVALLGAAFVGSGVARAVDVLTTASYPLWWDAVVGIVAGVVLLLMSLRGGG